MGVCHLFYWRDFWSFERSGFIFFLFFIQNWHRGVFFVVGPGPWSGYFWGTWGLLVFLRCCMGWRQNKFVVVKEVEGHIVIVLTELEHWRWVAVVVVTAVVGIRVTGALDSTRGFLLTSSCIASVCLVIPASLFWLLSFYSWKLSGVMAYWALQGLWGWDEEGWLLDLSVTSRSSFFLPKIGKGRVRKSRAYMILPRWHGLF